MPRFRYRHGDRPIHLGHLGAFSVLPAPAGLAGQRGSPEDSLTPESESNVLNCMLIHTIARSALLATLLGLSAVPFAWGADDSGFQKDRTEPVFVPSQTNPWLVEAGPFFEADVYPSLESAARALGYKLKAGLQRPRTGGTSSRSFVLNLQPAGQERDRILAAFLASFVDSEENMGAAAEGSDEARQFVSPLPIELAVLQDPLQTASKGGNDAPRKLSASIRLDGQMAQVHVNFHSKPWVEAFDAFCNSNIRHSWLLSRSGEMAASPEEAHEQALEGAARQLLKQVKGKVQISDPARGGSLRFKSEDAVIGETIAAMIRAGRFVEDRFIQRLRRPYGEVWREALLLKISQEQVDEVAESLLAGERTIRNQWQMNGLISAGILGASGLLYLLLNGLTKGYFMWRLRTFCLALAAAGIAGVLHLL